MKADKDAELEKRYMSWSTEDLIKATTVEKADYETDAVNLMLKELQKRNVSSDEVSVRQADIEQKIEAEKLSGIGGFLTFFLIIFTLNVFFSFWQGAAYILESASTQSFVSRSISVIPQFIIGAYGIYVFKLLIAKKYNAPRHTIRWLILGATVNFFIGILLFFNSGKLDFSIIAPISFALIWITYFTNSKRVKLTYCVK